MRIYTVTQVKLCNLYRKDKELFVELLSFLLFASIKLLKVSSDLMVNTLRLVVN